MGSCQIIHRDVRCDNILLKCGVVKANALAMNGGGDQLDKTRPVFDAECTAAARSDDLSLELLMVLQCSARWLTLARLVLSRSLSWAR